MLVSVSMGGFRKKDELKKIYRAVVISAPFPEKMQNHTGKKNVEKQEKEVRTAETGA